MNKEFLNILLNNNYSSIKLNETSVAVIYKPKFFSLKSNKQTIEFEDLVTYCEIYAKENNFYNKIDWKQPYIQLLYEVELYTLGKVK